MLTDRGRTRLIPCALAFAFVAIWIGGAIRLGFRPTTNVAGVRLRIVQPDVAQADKYRRSLQAAHWNELIDLSRVNHGTPPTHIIWPEAAPPFLLQRAPQALADIAMLTGGNKVLMTGAARADFTASVWGACVTPLSRMAP